MDRHIETTIRPCRQGPQPKNLVLLTVIPRSDVKTDNSTPSVAFLDTSDLDDDAKFIVGSSGNKKTKVIIRLQIK